MTGIPEWWLWVSAAFFIFEMLLVLGLLYAVFQMVKAIQQITPKIEAIAERVESIGTKVDHLADTVNDTVSNVGVRAKSVAGSADIIAHSASRVFEKYSPYIAAIMSGVKIMRAIREFQAHRNSGKKRD